MPIERPTIKNPSSQAFSPSMAETSAEGKGGPDEKMREYFELGQKFIERHKDKFYALAKDRSLKFEVGQGFRINLEKGVITLDVKDFKDWKEKGLTEWQIIWSVCHEIAHYKDLREDPQGMLENFRYIRRKAREIAPKVIEIWKRKWGDIPPHLLREAPIEGTTETMNGVEAFVFKQLHRNVYNALDDIYVNRLVSGFVAVFASDGSQRHQTSQLYRDYLFPTDPKRQGAPPRDDLEPADFAGYPKSTQLCDVLLRRAMVPDQAVLVSDEVAEIHASFRSDILRRLGLNVERETLEQATNPATKKAQKASTRYKYYQELVEGHFIALLLKDAENIPPPKEQQPGKPGGKPQPGEGDPWDLPNEAPPDPIDEQAIKDFLKQKKEKDKKDAEKKKQESRTPEQRAADAQKATDEKLCQERGVNPAAAQEYRRIQAEVQDHIKAVSQVFEQFMRDIEKRISMAWAEGFKSGRLNVERFISKYGHYMTEGGVRYVPWSSLDTYDRRDFISRVKLKPSRIRVRLVLDGSGSMDENKLKALKEVVVLLSESLSAFEATMNLRFKLQTPFVVDTEIRMFGSTTKVVKKFAQGKPTSDAEWADRFEAFGQINGGWGGTSDCLPLGEINDSLTPEYKAELESGSTKEIIVEITDGGTQTQDQTIGLIEVLEKQNLTTRALLIGSPEGSNDAQTFQATWGDKGERVPDVSQLAGTMTKLLAGEIRKVKAKIQYQGEDVEGLDEEDEEMGRIRQKISKSENPFGG